MSVSGLCAVCERREVEDGCERCGRLVCEKHLDRRTGLCTSCHAELHGGEGEPTRDPHSDPDRPDGVGEYRF
jgi:hypothetical protein